MLQIIDISKTIYNNTLDIQKIRSATILVGRKKTKVPKFGQNKNFIVYNFINEKNWECIGADWGD